ncbi:MAG TPA: phosphate signaling complex protein PhoU, partial [Kofleriaceae bacterium]|nr:phosphate signaling complex protein PhoU [Kofleriaceae bacterium]
MIGTHTSKDFETELRTLRERLCAMGGRCEQQITLAMSALADRDDDTARKVIENDMAIDRDENEIDELALQILATRQPVASDLRFITMSLKFVTDLERIGDLAAGIAKRALEINHLPPLGHSPDLGRLAGLVHKNLKAALDSFVARDADRAT